MKMQWLGVGAAIIACVALLYGLKASGKSLAVRRLSVGKTVFSVEVADTYIARAKGLSGHAPLSAAEGMLFIFSSPSGGAFWMQGMLFPIDIIWIRSGRVIGITENARPMSETGYRLYYPPSPADQVLEVNAGTVKKFRIRTGDKVQ
jgi:uncharacterized membrane protein (UPF0127 family)